MLASSGPFNDLTRWDNARFSYYATFKEKNISLSPEFECGSSVERTLSLPATVIVLRPTFSRPENQIFTSNYIVSVSEQT